MLSNAEEGRLAYGRPIHRQGRARIPQAIWLAVCGFLPLSDQALPCTQGMKRIRFAFKLRLLRNESLPRAPTFLQDSSHQATRHMRRDKAIRMRCPQPTPATISSPGRLFAAV